MNKISKIGLLMFLLNFIMMIVLVLLGQIIPGFIMYIFWVAPIITIAGGLIERRKNLQ